jgi:hypothetical protein
MAWILHILTCKMRRRRVGDDIYLVVVIANLRFADCGGNENMAGMSCRSCVSRRIGSALKSGRGGVDFAIPKTSGAR